MYGGFRDIHLWHFCCHPMKRKWMKCFFVLLKAFKMFQSENTLQSCCGQLIWMKTNETAADKSECRAQRDTTKGGWEPFPVISGEPTFYPHLVSSCLVPINMHVYVHITQQWQLQLQPLETTKKCIISASYYDATQWCFVDLDVLFCVWIRRLMNSCVTSPPHKGGRNQTQN